MNTLIINYPKQDLFLLCNVSAESEIGMQPNPVYGMGIADQILSMPNPGYGDGTNGHMQ